MKSILNAMSTRIWLTNIFLLVISFGTAHFYPSGLTIFITQSFAFLLVFSSASFAMVMLYKVSKSIIGKLLLVSAAIALSVWLSNWTILFFSSVFLGVCLFIKDQSDQIVETGRKLSREEGIYWFWVNEYIQRRSHIIPKMPAREPADN